MIAANPLNIVASTRSWLGTPYHDQASVRGVGVDCLGLARGVWRMEVGSEPLIVPPYSRDWGETHATEVLALGAAEWLIPIPVKEAGAGSVVLFRMIRTAIAKHVGILTGAGTFIHAYQGIGVIEEELTTVWARRIAFAFNFPAGPEAAEGVK